MQSYYTSLENIARLKSDLRFESTISYNINLPECPFYFFQLSRLYTMARRMKTQKSVTCPIAAVVKRIFEESGFGDVVVNSRILNVFKKKISLLQTAYRRASKPREKSLAKLLNGWKTGPKYQFNIYSNEVKSFEVK